MFEFRLKFHWRLFLKVQLTIFQHWFRYWLGAEQATSHYLNQWWPSSTTHTCVTRPQWGKGSLPSTSQIATRVGNLMMIQLQWLVFILQLIVQHESTKQIKDAIQYITKRYPVLLSCMLYANISTVYFRHCRPVQTKYMDFAILVVFDLMLVIASRLYKRIPKWKVFIIEHAKSPILSTHKCMEPY